MINNTEEKIEEELSLNGVVIDKVYYGEMDTITAKATLKSADALIFEVVKLKE